MLQILTRLTTPNCAVFKETCAGIVMLCNYYEDGMQKCDEYFPTESGAYKYYGKMFVNNKKVNQL